MKITPIPAPKILIELENAEAKILSHHLEKYIVAIREKQLVSDFLISLTRSINEKS